jgi:hypothetical protein
MRRDHTPLQVFTASPRASSSETNASAPAETPTARKARYDRTLHLASQPPSPMPRGAPVSPVLHAEIPAPLATAPPPVREPSAHPAIAPPPGSRAPAPLARRSSFRVAIDRFVARVAAWLEGLVARLAR